MFNAVGASSAQNVLKRLEMVDNVERLGIGRYFQKEIAEALGYVFRYWNDISKDLNTAALGLRILRLHRYPVSPDVLEQLKEKDGQFLYCTTQSEEEIKSILNLFRASLIDFPNEKIMEEAKAFTTMYLNQVLQKTHVMRPNLLQEIAYNLEYGWRTNLPRLEARNYMAIYEENSSWVKNMDNKKILYLAKLDFNIMQSLYRPELRMISRWWTDSGLCKLESCRHRPVEYHFSGWDSPSIVCLPEYMKIAYCALYDAINESAQEVEKTQGRDTLHYAREAWDNYLDSMLQEAKWNATGYIPDLKTYLENAKESSASRIATLQTLLTLDAILPEDVLKKIDYPSRFNDLLGLTLRLRGDTRTFKAEANRGEVASAITCYMRDHPKSSEEDALKYLNFMLDKHLKELNWEYLKHDDVPACVKDFAYDMSRCFQVFYKERDGFSICSKDMKKHVEQILIKPIEM